MFITKRALLDYQQLQSERKHGRLLTPAGLRLICEAEDNSPEAIGLYFLRLLARLEQEEVLRNGQT